MVNFSGISNKSFAGRILRGVLEFLPKSLIFPILQGPNKGFKWMKGSGVNGYWLGSYETKKQMLMAKFIREKMICYDIGAHTGYYTLMFSRLSGKRGRVFSFEPNPFNLFYLLKHLELNKIKNVNAFPVALWEKEDYIPLVLNSSMSCLNKNTKKNLLVPTFKIDNLISQGYIVSPDIVKIDVEGAELEVLKGMENALRTKSIILFIALDDRGKRENVFSFLENLGYKVYNLDRKTINLSQVVEVDEIISTAGVKI